MQKRKPRSNAMSVTCRRVKSTLHDLVAVKRISSPFLLASDLRHADYLIPFAGGYHAEILRFLVDASACVLHFRFGMAFGAGICVADMGRSWRSLAAPLSGILVFGFHKP